MYNREIGVDQDWRNGDRMLTKEESERQMLSKTWKRLDNRNLNNSLVVMMWC